MTGETHDDSGGASGDGSRTAIRWVCEDCGQEHPKRSPPCSNCGSMSLEATEFRIPDVGGGENESEEDGDGGMTIRRAVVLGIGGILGAGAYFVGIKEFLADGGASSEPPDQRNPDRDDQAAEDDPATASATSTPTPTTTPPPTLENVPGAATESGNLDLELVATALNRELNARREEAGHDDLRADETMRAFATYHNQHMVKFDHYPYGTEGYDPRETALDFGIRCGGRVLVNRIESTRSYRADEYYTSEGRVAEEIVTGWFENQQYRDAVLEATETIGSDVHADTDGSLYFTVAVC